MKKLLRAATAATLIAGMVALVPNTAHAVVSNSADPTGDVTAGNSYDVTQVTVTLTTSTVTVAVDFAGAVPALTDPTWATSSDMDGRSVGVGFGDALGGGFYLDGDGLLPIDRNGEEITSAKCTVPTENISGSTITFSGEAKCFDYPGKIEARVVVSSTEDPTTGEVDAAIAPAVTAFPFDPDTTTITPVTATLPGGYYQLGADGGVFSFGNAVFHGSTGNITLNKPVVGMSTLSGGTGYRFVASDGGVFCYGAAQSYGSMGGKPLNKPVVGMATTPSGNGYWLVASDGGIFAYGDAVFYGSMGGKALNKPIVGMMPTAHGYYLVASDGGIFAYGDAVFHGSLGSAHLNKPIVGGKPTTTGNGYLLVASDGGVFAYGDATYRGSGVHDFNNNVVAIGTDGTNNGYYLTGADGSIVNYGTVKDFGDIHRLLDAGGKSTNAATVGFDNIS